MTELVWKEMNGASPGTPTTITHLKHKCNDDCLNDTNYTTPIPGSGVNHAFWKTIYLYAVTLAEIFSNFKLYGGGVPSAGTGTVGWTGVTLYIGDETSDTYERATGVVSEGGDELVANHGQVSSKTDFLGTYISGNKKSIGLPSGVLSITGNAQRISKYIYLQLTVGPMASHGLLATASLIGTYDLA